METMKVTGLALVAALIGTSAFADISLSGTAPSSGVLSSATGGINSNIIDEDSNDNHGRGQLFSLGDATGGTGYKITAITIKKNGAQTFSSDTMNLRIFEGTEADWATGTGHSTADDGDNYFVDTTVDVLYSEAFTLDGTIAGTDYVTFTLATPVVVNENSDFGFLMVYEQGASSTTTQFGYSEGSTGGRVAITTTAHATPGTRNMHYYVEGTVIPEPATLGLFAAFGGAVMFIRRRFMI